MSFQRLRVHAFRNLHSATIPLDAHQVLLIGENGHGKTNLLEALYLASYGAGFRARRDAELIRHGESGCSVHAWITGEASLDREIDVRLADGKKQIAIDGSPIADRRDMIESLATILFRHDDFDTVAGPPELQRRFVDQTGSLVTPAHVDDLRRYAHVLAQRNAALRAEQYAVLDVLDEQLVAAGIPVIAARRETIAAFRPVLEAEYRAVSGIETAVEIEYRPSWGRDGDPIASELLLAAVQERRATDMRMGTTTSGPHRDRIVFRHGGRDFLVSASTGQTRLLVLILRIAQARFVAERTARPLVLLLDDVLLELDPVRRGRLISRLPANAQRIFTLLPGEPVDAYREAGALLYSVCDGGIEPLRG